MAKTDNELCENTFGTETPAFRETGGPAEFDAALGDFDLEGKPSPQAAAKTAEKARSKEPRPGFWGWLRRLFGGR